MTSDVTLEKIVSACSVLREAESHQLEVRAHDDPEDVKQAWEILHSETPLKVRWPDGSRVRPAPWRPREVISLADGWGVRVSHVDEEHAEAQRSIRAELGRRPPRACGGTTKAGASCGSSALPYIERPRCHAHACFEERSENKRLNKEESERLNVALQRIGHERAMKS